MNTQKIEGQTVFKWARLGWRRGWVVDEIASAELVEHQRAKFRQLRFTKYPNAR